MEKKVNNNTLELKVMVRALFRLALSRLMGAVLSG
jgi:hypothetical protein